jgi:hypothetical protein
MHYMMAGMLLISIDEAIVEDSCVWMVALFFSFPEIVLECLLKHGRVKKLHVEIS